MSEAIPPAATHDGRTIVLCFDGTQNKISDKLSNVALLFSLLDRTDPSKQLVYYQTGIGTYTSSALTKGPISSTIAKTLDSMVATSLDDHVKEGYRYLMDNYSPGDKICVFGFSRGAHTARALVAMLYKVGLLQRGNHQHIEYAWAAFILRTEEGWARAATFKRMFGMSVPIEFVGVWDSVGSVGIDGLAIQFGLNNTTVKTFRHALALDERRCRFKVNAWEAYNYKQAPSFLQFEDQNYKSSGLDTPTDVLEVWFAGAHSDVGGGNSTITEEHALSRIPLRWMVRECFKTKSGIRFSITALRDIGMDPDALYPEVKKRPPLIFTESLSETDKTRLMERLPVKASQQETYTDVDEDPFADHTQLTEEEEDLLDSMCGVRDELQHRKIWWLLEILPLRQFLQQSSGDWEFSWTINLGRPRFIPSQTKRTVNVHRSVRQKMENEDWLEGMERYQPKASLAVALETENVLWVD